MANKRRWFLLARIVIGGCVNEMVGIEFQRNGREDEEQMV
jgi:hypothetical protein